MQVNGFYEEHLARVSPNVSQHMQFQTRTTKYVFCDQFKVTIVCEIFIEIQSFLLQWYQYSVISYPHVELGLIKILWEKHNAWANQMQIMALNKRMPQKFRPVTGLIIPQNNSIMQVVQVLITSNSADPSLCKCY